jgi:hypothetical protein
MVLVKAIKAGVLYFAIVFGTGFLLGTIRTLLIVPHLGARTAELLEVPLMVAVSFVAARWIVRRMELPFLLSLRMAMGTIALALMLVAEFSFVLSLRRMSLRQYFATLDPISGTAYYVSLLLFALAPIVIERKSAG